MKDAILTNLKRYYIPHWKSDVGIELTSSRTCHGIHFGYELVQSCNEGDVFKSASLSCRILFLFVLSTIFARLRSL